MPTPLTVTMETDVPVVMRDGVTLRGELIRPAGPGPYPTLIVRNPYGAAIGFLAGRFNPLNAVKRGYAVLLQDCRGCFTSDGEFYAFHQEQADGYDTVEWAAAQPWSDGNIGVAGASYLGCTTWQAALAGPPHLKAVAPASTATDYRDGWVYQGGALLLDFALTWGLGVRALRLREFGLRPEEAAVLALMAQRPVDYEAVYAAFAGEPPRLRREVAPYIFDWLERAEDDAYWEAVNVARNAGRVTVPAFNQGGWYDIFQEGPGRAYAAMRAGAGSEAARTGQRLVMGAWHHLSMGSISSRVGEVDFGPASTNRAIEAEAALFRFFDTYLRGASPSDEAPVRLFVMGANAWRDEREWPPARAVPTAFFLHSDGGARTAGGDGRLERVAPSAGTPDSYLYDPRDPTPTRGSMLISEGGAFDQRPVEARADVLCYTTEPLAEDLEVTGPVELVLWAASSAPTSDWAGKLVDVAPDGFAQNVTDGLLRVHRLTPDEPAETRVNLGVTSHLFRRGHRLRLEVASANYPRFDRNPLNGKRLLDASSRPARQTVYHERAFPSRLVLPVVPG